MTGSPPLQGLRILAISQFGAGPFGTTALADMGAEVIKIEDPPAGGDVARYVPPFAIEGDSLYFQSFNRGKKSIGLDLRTAEGQQVFEDLVKVSDGVFNNLRGDLTARLGLNYEALKHLNPAIVCCSLPGFGATGPRASEPGYDAIIQGYAGYMSITGEPEGAPAKCGVSIIDFAGGYASALGLTAGLLDAARTGVGRDVDVSLMDTAVAMLSYFAAWNLNRGWEPVRTPASGHQTLVPSQNFRTADGWIVIFCAKETFWRNLATALGVPELATDPRFATFADRYKNRNELVPLLEEEFLRHTTREWLEIMRGKVPCAPVNSVANALKDEQVLARGMIVDVEHPQYGTIREVGSPIKTTGVLDSPAPAPSLGQHTDVLLDELLGYSEDRIAELRSLGAVV